MKLCTIRNYNIFIHDDALRVILDGFNDLRLVIYQQDIDYALQRFEKYFVTRLPWTAWRISCEYEVRIGCSFFSYPDLLLMHQVLLWYKAATLQQQVKTKKGKKK